MTFHQDGQRSPRAHCEIEAGVVTDRSVRLETAYTTDSQYHPLDCFVRLHESGKFLGSGWFCFTDEGAECEHAETFSCHLGSMMDVQGPAPVPPILI